jgi:ribosomal protein L37AE/L43A
MSKPICPDCGKSDRVVKKDSGHYACQDCGDMFDKDSNKLKR